MMRLCRLYITVTILENKILELEKIEDRFEKLIRDKKDILYTDRFFNVILSESDREYACNYDYTYNLLKSTWYPVFKSKINMLNGKLGQYKNQKNK
ncbi:hypothetical protein HGI32_11810 [Clostridium acetobutylicum]|uniref:Uncharacterized protein n=1 Tax=Clostridium acetobutylicum (strain ATCC 824 / DSM 792 / JCM 1419 / IAM 19013 / LMG 5710 / NBRC 13948 / NRRL B-527 / VKM B-1787 / 2291 / W) TaxID=272562 RepID=Q97H32_CLOAB|nr:Hypothetical protein CA_C2181 [Clostridium acetobutylicum ATCC 824]AEI32212.1 hypothetical protein SMB_G2214 [Clostridium acetobutylicum DSM 1731]AWV79436.1 hypothetical protein DK921_04845 [Clostridium acetobutylicum]PSM07396.1 hypothetical protein C7T89_04845 [Clostridium sp. NJ4]MBC2394593.1 hypothetical protein [Clostridium acetobutylicum]